MPQQDFVRSITIVAMSKRAGRHGNFFPQKENVGIVGDFTDKAAIGEYETSG
ncbi:Uncharacterised protein [Yersinia enterocolitica]|nr:Uncharacterised protein [Yersinia enterocolitica]